MEDEQYYWDKARAIYHQCVDEDRVELWTPECGHVLVGVITYPSGYKNVFYVVVGSKREFDEEAAEEALDRKIIKTIKCKLQEGMTFI